jgi:predicted HicB family RNase H-like nuclease
MANLSIRLEQNLKEKIKLAAELEGVSLHAFVVRLIERLINEYKSNN